MRWLVLLASLSVALVGIVGQPLILFPATAQSTDAERISALETQVANLNRLVATPTAGSVTTPTAPPTPTDPTAPLSAATPVARSLATYVASARGTAQALATVNASLSAQATISASSAQETVATAQAAATANATLAAGAISVAATNVALTAALQEAKATTTALAVVAAANALDPNAVTRAITVDARGVQAGGDQAIADARAAVRTGLAPFAACRAGFVLIVAGGDDLGVASGVALAESAEGWLKQTYPDVFGSAGFDAVASTSSDMRGVVEFKMFLHSGCALPSG